MESNINLTLACAAAAAVVSCCASAATPEEIAAVERRADAAVERVPVVRTAELAAHSTNRLSFALNNGLGMTAKGHLWAMENNPTH